MASMYNQVEERIKNAQNELKHLEEEQQALRNEEKNMPRDSYIREELSLRNHITAQENIIRDNQIILNAYNAARNSILDLRKLHDLYDTERDSQIRKEINEEIEAKEKELQHSRDLLPEELQEELRASILNDMEERQHHNSENTIVPRPITNQTSTTVNQTENQSSTIVEEEQQINEEQETISNQTEVQKERNINDELQEARQELEQARKDYQDSIEKMQEIYRNEQNRFEEGEWNTTSLTGFDEFVEEYIAKMEVENSKFVDAQRRIERAQRKIEQLSKIDNVERVRQEQKVRELSISDVQYNRIVEAVSKRNIYAKVLEQQGLGEIIHKRGGRTKAEREKVNAAKQELIDKLVAVQQKQTEEINIKETIDMLYNTQLTAKQTSESRKIKLTKKATENITETVEKTPKRIVKDPTYQPTYTPGKAPADVPRITARPAPLGLPAGTTPLALPAGTTPLALPAGATPLALTAGKNKQHQIQQQMPTPKQKNIPVEPKIQPKASASEIKPKVTTPAKPVVTPKMQPTPATKPLAVVKPNVPQKNPTNTQSQKKQPQTGLMTIMEKLTKGLDITRTDGKAYKASNIKVAENFKNELSSGNYLYNIVHLVPAIVKVPVQFLTKVSGKLRYNKESKHRMKVLKSRIEKLSEEEIETIYNEYRGNRVIQERFPSAINILLEEKIQNHIMGKVTAINTQLEKDYADIYKTIKQLEATDAKLRDRTISPEQRQQLRQYRAKLISGKSEQVQRIRNNYVTAENLLSGGLQGFSQDMKAASTKLSCVGKRFAKDHDLDQELLAKQARLERAERQAIADGNDEMALRVFVQAEAVLSEETKISNSLAGKRSTGKKYYSPLAERLDYRDDPFVRDLFTTIAVTSAALTSVNSLRGNSRQEINAANQQITEANQQLADAQKLVNTIKGKQTTFKDGMEAQAVQTSTNITGQVERATLDAHNWAIGSRAYNNADATGHAFYNEVFENTQTAMTDISTQYASGAITQAEALGMMRDIANGAQTKLNAVSTECITIFNEYAKTHPGFNLTALTEGVKYITQHPNAITDMNNAIVDISNMADGLTFTQIEALKAAPTSMIAPLVNAASVAALAGNVSTTMTKNVKSGKYGNSVTKMVEEYVQNTQKDKEQQNANQK